MEYINQRKTLEQFAKEYVQVLKTVVPKDTGRLSNSINYNIEGDTISFEALSYIVLQEEGVNGTKVNRGSRFSFTNKRPPIDALQGFARRKGINVWALQRSLFEKGFEGKHFIQNTLDKELEAFGSLFADAVWEDFAGEMINLK